MPKKKPQKSTRRRASTDASESHQRRQERLEQRRRAKEEALIAQRKRERRARAVRTTVFVGVATLAVYFLILRQTSPAEIAGHEIQEFSTNNGGTATHTAPYQYDAETTGTKPPVSGRHNPNPASCGTHAVPIADENLVHTLEHGAVGILFTPNAVEQKDVDAIEDVVNDYDEFTFSAPYPGMESPVMVVSWSRRMPLESLDADAAREYIDTFVNTEPAPEAGAQECPNTEEDSYEVAEPEASPQPSPPVPAPSPGGEAGGQDGPGDGSGAGGDGKDPGGGKDPAGDGGD